MPPLLSPCVEPGAMKRSITVRPRTATGEDPRSPRLESALRSGSERKAAPSEEDPVRPRIRHLIENLKP